MPLHLGHIELMERAARYGAVLAPPVPAFYNRPRTLDDIIDHAVGKVLDLMGIEHTLLKRWKEGEAPRRKAAAGPAPEATDTDDD
jgi:4-hydroxy-3-polyprenylbenzoate decarboxylase